MSHTSITEILTVNLKTVGVMFWAEPFCIINLFWDKGTVRIFPKKSNQSHVLRCDNLTMWKVSKKVDSYCFTDHNSTDHNDLTLTGVSSWSIKKSIRYQVQVYFKCPIGPFFEKLDPYQFFEMILWTWHTLAKWSFA